MAQHAQVGTAGDRAPSDTRGESDGTPVRGTRHENRPPPTKPSQIRLARRGSRFGRNHRGAPATGSPPVAEAAGREPIALEPVNETFVILADLAGRSQQKPVTVAGIGPYTITGTDSRTGQPSSFVTDYFSDPTHPEEGGSVGQRE